MSEEINLHETTDASVWAKEWLQVYENALSIDDMEGWMVGWFANAIMAGAEHEARSYGKIPISEYPKDTAPVVLLWGYTYPTETKCTIGKWDDETESFVHRNPEDFLDMMHVLSRPSHFTYLQEEE